MCIYTHTLFTYIYIFILSLFIINNIYILILNKLRTFVSNYIKGEDIFKYKTHLPSQYVPIYVPARVGTSPPRRLLQFEL